MEASEDTEDSKCDIVYQLLCMACLGSGQTLHILREEALKLYKLTVNDGRQLVHNVAPRVCWECEVLLKRVLQFRERVMECHHILYSARVTRSDVTRAPRLRVHRTAAVDIPPLTECDVSQVNPETETDVYIKREIETDVYIKVEEQSSLCPACLCAGRRMISIRDKELHYYTDILTQIKVESGVSSPRLCWECSSVLLRATRFSEQVAESYRTLLPSLQHADVQDITTLLCAGVSLPPRLSRCVRACVDIPPHAPTHTPPTAHVRRRESSRLSLLKSSNMLKINQKKASPSTYTESSTLSVLKTASPRTYCRAARPSTSAGNISTVQELHLQPLISTDAEIEDSEDTGEDSKCDIVYQLLCMACLGSGQTLHILRDEALKLYKLTVNDGRQLVYNLAPRVCWECEVLLKRVLQFRERVTECHHILYSARVTRSDVTRAPRLRVHRTAAVDIPSLTECDVSQVNPETETDVYIKREIETHVYIKREIEADVYIKMEASETEWSSLCPVCLCAGRRMISIRDKELHYYRNILTQNRVESGVSSPLLCWECCSVLLRATRFSEQVAESYRMLLPSLQHADVQDLNEFLQTSVRRPGRLNTRFAFSIDISPQDDDAQVMTVTKHDDDVDEAHTGKKPYQCKVCHKSFSRQNYLSIHLILHTGEKPYQCEVCHKLFSEKGHLVSHIRTHTGGKPYQCKVCHKSFSRKNSLAIHLRLHTGEKPYQCEVCHKSFSEKGHLVSHIRTHTGEKPYQCKVCHKSFSGKGHLVSHIRTHTGEKPYQCEVCHKSFSEKGHLVSHIRTHTGEKPYQCKVCHKSFSGKSYLVSHIRTHTGENPYQCKVCHKSFSQKSSLVLHIRTHTGEKPYQCKVCNKSFSIRSTLAYHIRTHTGEKPYQCKVCHKAFPRKNTLAAHLLLHTGEKPYQCEVCHKSFPVRSTLVTHIRTHTGSAQLKS